MLVGELRVGDREASLQVLATDLREARSASVSTRETKKLATDATFGRVAARLDQPLEPADERLGDGRVALEREDERDVDRAPRGDRSSIAPSPGFVAGIFTNRFLTIAGARSFRLLDRGVRS